MKKFLKIMLLIFLILLGTSIFAYAEGSSIELRVDKENVLLNEDVTVEFKGKNLEDIAGANLEINYDSNKLELISKEIVLDKSSVIDIPKEIKVEQLKDTEGKIRIMFGIKKDKDLISGEETMAAIKFKAKSEGEAKISFGQTELIKEINKNGEFDYAYENVQFPVKELIIYIKNQVIKEDVDQNGRVELEDLVCIAKCFGLRSGEDGWNPNADMNKDKKVDMLDILFVSRKLE